MLYHRESQPIHRNYIYYKVSAENTYSKYIHVVYIYIYTLLQFTHGQHAIYSQVGKTKKNLCLPEKRNI